MSTRQPASPDWANVTEMGGGIGRWHIAVDTDSAMTIFPHMWRQLANQNDRANGNHTWFTEVRPGG